MNDGPTCFAIIPAAGQSRRMQPAHKLLLAWQGRPMIEHVVDIWRRSQVDRIVITIRNDSPELEEILSGQAGLDLVVPQSNPVDMKESIRCALDHVEARYAPSASDRWLVAPADVPTMNPELINRLIEHSRRASTAVAPRFGNRGGHPVSFPWSMKPEVDALRADQGLDHLVASGHTKWVNLPSGLRPADIDTPDDYRRLTGEGERGTK